jgi:hypothetical protein
MFACKFTVENLCGQMVRYCIRTVAVTNLFGDKKSCVPFLSTYSAIVVSATKPCLHILQSFSVKAKGKSKPHGRSLLGCCLPET